MSELKKEVIEKAVFVFDSYKSDARIDIISKIPGQPSSFELKVSADENYPIKFAYQYGDGLVAIEKINTKRASNILGEFLKINNDFEKYDEFFQNYGFLFKIPTDRFARIDPVQIMRISQRLKCLVDLINEVNNYNNEDYRKMMELSLFLFFDEGWNIQIDKDEIQSPKYELAELINTDAFNQICETINRQEEINLGYFLIKDTLLNSYKLNATEYHEIVDGYSNKPGYDDFKFKAITYLYANYKNHDNKAREIIDLLFHYYRELGIPSKIDSDHVTYFTRFKSGKMDNYFIDGIYDFAKYIIKQEIDSNISKIHPVYNEDEMRPDWKVDSLLSAMYFSLFYLDSKNEMLRHCEHCDRYFVVKRSSSTKKYCDSYCRNNAQQAKHRIRLKNSK
ncbi:MAG: DUF6076 domain-containing protein [Acholeplasma sp.]|nr:DUF6076 domain-containing protein [Acholeplasma sp.]